MDVQDLIRRVSRHFFDLVDDDANPLVVALALQDNSSVGLQYYAEEFTQLREELRSCLKARVDENYHGFNESVGVYRHAGSALKSSHDGVIEVTSQLVELQTLVASKKEVLGDLHLKSVRLKHKLEILADLEELYAFPVKNEELIAQKRYSESQNLLGKALEMITSRNLLKQRKLRPLLTDIRRQQLLLVERLAEDTKSQIFLKTPYASRVLQLGNKDFEIFKDNFSKLYDECQDQPLDTVSNYYVQLLQLIRNLSDMRGFESSLDSLNQTCLHELRTVWRDTTTQAVQECRITQKQLQKIINSKANVLQKYKKLNHKALETLTQELYMRLLRILECHCCLSMTAKQLGFQYSLDGFCESFISIVNQFLLKYIGMDTPAPVDDLRNRTTNASNRTTRSRGESLFQFGNEEEDTRGLRDFQALRESIKKSIPGLLADDPNNMYAETAQQEQVDMVVPANILNIKNLLEPTIELFGNAIKLVETSAQKSKFTNFLRTFLHNSFIPRLQRSFEKSIDDIRKDQSSLRELADWSTLSKLPLMKCGANLAEVTSIFIKLLDVSHRYREEYTRIIVTLLKMSSDYFLSHLGDLFTVGQAHQHVMVWNLAVDQRHGMSLQQRYNGKPNPLKEFEVYFSKRHTPYTAKSLLTLSDLLDIGIYKQATLLITTVRWFVHWMRKVRRTAGVSEIEADKSIESEVNIGDETVDNDVLVADIRQKWNLLEIGPENTNIVAFSIIMLAGKSLQEYDAIVDALEKCVFRALSALRCDIFLRVVYYFDQMITNNDFHEGGRGDKRDPIVDRIQRELSMISQVTNVQLVTTDRDFLIGGIAQFMNELFILEGDNIGDMDEAGQNQILTNIFAFQQMSTSFVSDPREVDFSRATWFYELFRLTPTLIIERAKLGETCLGKDDLSRLLQIRHRNAANSSSSTHSFGTLDFHLSQLDEIFSTTKRTASQQSATGVVNSGDAVDGNTQSRAAANGSVNVPQTSQASLNQQIPAHKSASGPAVTSKNASSTIGHKHTLSSASAQTRSSPRSPPLPNRRSLPNSDKIRSSSRTSSGNSSYLAATGDNPPPLPPKTPPRSPSASSTSFARYHTRTPSNPVGTSKTSNTPIASNGVATSRSPSGTKRDNYDKQSFR